MIPQSKYPGFGALVGKAMGLKPMLIVGALALIIGGVFLVLGSTTVVAQGADISSEPFEVFAFEGNQSMPGPGNINETLGNVVPGSSSQLVRTDNGVSISAHIPGLAPGAYTTWWSISTDDDLSFPDEIVILAGGGIVGPNGEGYFAAHLSVGEIAQRDFVNVVINKDGNQVFDSPRTDTIRFTLRYHGPKVPGMVAEQTHSFLGGCINNAPIMTTGPFVCFDPWRTTHTP